MLKRVALAVCLIAAAPTLAFAQAALTLPQKQQAAPQRQAPPPMDHIEPANQVERTLIAALSDEAQRPAFRQQFLAAQVSVAMMSNAANAQPMEFPIRQNAMFAAVFTSAARQDQVLGPNSSRRVMTGREALTLLRGKNVAINPQLSPMITLEASDVATWLN